MKPPKKLTLTFALTALSLTFAAAASARAGAQKGRPQQPRETTQRAIPNGLPEDIPPGWRRYELDGGGGEWISAVLPAKPEDFGYTNMRRASGDAMKVRVHMIASDKKVFFAAFIDLPKPAAEMSDRERGETFYGCWMAFATKTGQALEEKLGPLPITPSGQMSAGLPGGHEQRSQDFKLGTQNGRAQVIFAGRRAYMLAAVWDERPDSEKDAKRFLDSFRVGRVALPEAEMKK